MQISNVENTKNPSNYSIRVRDKLVDLSTPIVMGIINATPDSFYAGSRYESIRDVLNVVEKMQEQGVNIVDIGGYSSRPNALNINNSEEINRVSPIISAVRKEFEDLNISLDTFRSDVARIGIECGADIINDISGFEIDSKIIDIVAHYEVPYVLMHMIGTPQNMTTNTSYKNLFNDMSLYYSSKIEILKKKGVNDIILDPGFGFSKTIEQNYEILDFLEHLQLFNKPILVGLSRKSMIYKKLDIRPQDSLPETTRLNNIALDKGASILRVHDVKEAVELINIRRNNITKTV